MVEKLQIIIARHAEQMRDTASCQSVEQVIGDGIGGLYGSDPFDVSLSLSIEEARSLSRKLLRSAWKAKFTAVIAKNVVEKASV